ncbi:IS3 family transposase [uncultured Paraglaciecola sp.]|uniref:IS3 family transposase n=1 Tax=uncultured Paraglaciecola sp. TaxID=1765024 RepID=UPI0025DADEB0|nr:IS3 family transposase [uncultured Paraglaciecola sp.]
MREQIKASYLQSGCMYGRPRVTHEMRCSGETCGEKRVAKLMKQDIIRANIGSSPSHSALENLLQQKFVVYMPDTA